MTTTALFKNASIGILIADRQGTIKQCNPFAMKIFGYEDNELTGQKVDVLIPENLRHRNIDNRDFFWEQPNPRVFGADLDLIAVKKSGETIPVEVSISHYEESEGPSVAVFINDVSKRRQVQSKLEGLSLELELRVAKRTRELTEALSELSYTYENLELEIEHRKEVENHIRANLEREKELNDLKSRLVSMASHEFRTPLGGILTSVSLIDKYLHNKNHVPGSEAKIDKHIRTIKKSVKNLTSVLNTFIDMDKFDHGMINADPIRFNLSKLINEIVLDLSDVNDKSQTITFRHSGEDLILYQDKDMLRNVLINLLSNATKYSCIGGEIVVEITILDSKVIISVADQGIGIPEEEQKYLFSRFFRAHNVKAIQGTGLGLTIVKNYVELMGGKIGVTSKENAGTTFEITLPLEMK